MDFETQIAAVEIVLGICLNVLFMNHTRTVMLATLAAILMFLSYVVAPYALTHFQGDIGYMGLLSFRLTLVIALIIVAAITETPVFVPSIVVICAIYGCVSIVQICRLVYIHIHEPKSVS